MEDAPGGCRAGRLSALCPSSTEVQVGVVEAWDADQTEANNRISFSLSGSGANNFMVRGLVLGSGQAAGRLSLPSDVSLDYETQASFSLIVSAENVDAQGHETTAEVLVAVEDVNDVPPTLDSASLQASGWLRMAHSTASWATWWPRTGIPCPRCRYSS